jgi:hypothetical protein
VEPNPNIPAIASIEAACSREVERVATPLTDEQRRAIRVALRSALSPQAAAPQAGAGYGDTSPGDVIAAYADGQIVLDDGIETTSYPRACAFLHAALSSAQARVADVERESARAEREWLQTNLNYQAELDRERAARAEMQRLYEHRGAALLRPCISCGYQPKVVAASNAAQDPT